MQASLTEKKKFCSWEKKIIEEEVDKFRTIRFIQKAHYFKWLANIIMIKKINEKWRICIDYTNLSKTFSKDSFYY